MHCIAVHCSEVTVLCCAAMSVQRCAAVFALCCAAFAVHFSAQFSAVKRCIVSHCGLNWWNQWTCDASSISNILATSSEVLWLRCSLDTTAHCWTHSSVLYYVQCTIAVYCVHCTSALFSTVQQYDGWLNISWWPSCPAVELKQWSIYNPTPCDQPYWNAAIIWFRVTNPGFNATNQWLPYYQCMGPYQICRVSCYQSLVPRCQPMVSCYQSEVLVSCY